MSLGSIHHSCGELEEAKKHCLKAYREGEVNAALGLGEIHQEPGQLDEAERFFEMALAGGIAEAGCKLGTRTAANRPRRPPSSAPQVRVGVKRPPGIPLRRQAG